jgi:hypothetical protein
MILFQDLICWEKTGWMQIGVYSETIGQWKDIRSDGLQKTLLKRMG